ncbi:MAG: type II toxin-antitoxin system RelE/ParE family toxin [Chitinophagaceae bacterium]
MALYTIYLTPTADKDLLIAIDYYNQQAEDLGYRFADLVEKYIANIALLPTASSIRYKNVRCKPIAIFPYLIMFTVDEINKTVNILRIFHTSQEPFW